ncbi:hypothetical protein NCCP2716_14690 [Sporosarcina sp. NCCP-2716]|uniref:hypothetical protein n=1 Tax=Sporosarcina sp. NCCP-2716 TaxID=2943679 RepID=UPI0020410F10|nr:hypothetical protein [Sporosarcina sp. NCCP-2716]GKV68971.1 hypothetical protein NCCP2716_14690 [Sporosarcina sp. NCCP-2716]
MPKSSREELQSLSTQFLEIFIKDVFSKHKVNTSSVKDSMSEEQRQQLKTTVEKLKGQVEDFLQNQSTVKSDMEKEAKEQPSSSPLRESFRSKKETEDIPDTPDE